MSTAAVSGRRFVTYAVTATAFLVLCVLALAATFLTRSEPASGDVASVEAAVRAWSARERPGNAVREVIVHGAWSSCATASVVLTGAESVDVVATLTSGSWVARKPEARSLDRDEVADEAACHEVARG